MTSVFYFDDFELDCGTFSLRHIGGAVRVDVVVLRVLESLVRSAGQLISKDQLMADVWGGRVVSDNALTVSVSRLRKLFNEYGMPRESILTVHGVGYRFTRRVSSRSRNAESASPLEAHATEFVGRRHVILQLVAALADAQNGRGRLVALRGEAGIGKTRVAEVFAEYAAHSGCAVAWGCCRERAGTPPLWPFVELLRGMTGTQPSAATSTLPHELMPLPPDLACYAGHTHSEPPASGAPHELGSQQHKLFESIARRLTDPAEGSTRVLILDDLPSADETSLELLRYLLPNLGRMRVLVVATLRGVYGDSATDSPLTAVLVHRNCLRIPVEPLNQADVTNYIAARFGKLDRALAQKVYEVSEGNPFCMVEMAAQLQTGCSLDAAELTVPEVVRELARKRMTELDHDTREVLTCAAVIGRMFGVPLLAAVTGRDAVALMVTLDSAVAAHVVRAVVDSNTEFTFVHGSLLCALYDGQSPSERRMRHLRVAQALEQRRALAEVPLAKLAHHAWSALPEGDLKKTVEYCSQAALAAEQACAFADATRLLKDAREALDLTDDGSPHDRFRLLFRQALNARFHSSHEFVLLAEQLVRSASERGGKALAEASLLVDPLPGFPRLPVRGAALADAIAALPADVPSLRPALVARLASSAPLAYTANGCYAEIERALLLASRSPERADRFAAHFGELYLYGGPEHKVRGASTVTALRRLCNEAPVGPLPSTLLDLHCTVTALQCGDIAAASRALERWEQHGRELKGEMLWHMERLRAFVQINLGNVAEGQQALVALHRRTRCCDESASAGLFCVYDQHLPLPSSEPFAAAPAALGSDAKDPPNIWALKVRTLELGGALDDARNALELVPAERLRELPCDREFLGTMGALARTAVRLQAHPYTRVIYERLSPFPEHFAVGLSGFCEGSVSLLLGLLARSLGDTQRAGRHFDVAHGYSNSAGFSRSASEVRMERTQSVSSDFAL